MQEPMLKLNRPSPSCPMARRCLSPGRTVALTRPTGKCNVLGSSAPSRARQLPSDQISKSASLIVPVFGADPVVNTVYMGDYDTWTLTTANFYTTFLDSRLGNQDVRFAKIPKAGPGPSAVATLADQTRTSWRLPQALVIICL